MLDNKKVLNKWIGDCAVAYRIENVLVFYSTENDPMFTKNEEVSFEQVKNSKYYRNARFISIEESIPSDLSMAVIF